MEIPEWNVTYTVSTKGNCNRIINTVAPTSVRCQDKSGYHSLH